MTQDGLKNKDKPYIFAGVFIVRTCHHLKRLTLCIFIQLQR